MSNLRAKFRITEIKYNKDEKGQTNAETIRLVPVYSVDKTTENYQWSQWTPSGELWMTITNPDAFGKIANGHEFYLDLTPCEHAETATA